jgi:hypothetical protein
MYEGTDVLTCVLRAKPLRDTSREGAEVVANFSPTRFELLHSARYWIRRILKLELFMTETGSISGNYFDTIRYANQRLDEIDLALGGNEVKKLVADEKERARRLAGDRLWSAYESGDRKEIDKLREECHSPRDGSTSLPTFAIVELARHATIRLPELSGHRLAQAMRVAAENVEAGSGPSNNCSHEWASAGSNNEDDLWADFDFERCRLCDALREPRQQ